jgi:uncharacterized protein YndB with AHSA1/START domain
MNASYGTRIDIGGAPALRFTRYLAHPPEKVWTALVEPESLARWQQAQAVVEPHEGGCFRLVLGGRSSTMNGVITRWEPPTLLEYTWPESAANGDSLIRFELQRQGEGTILILTHILKGGGDLADFASGWHWHLDALNAALAGEARSFDHAGWAVLRQEYVATL